MTTSLKFWQKPTLPLFNYITKAWQIQLFTFASLGNIIDITECHIVLVFIVLSDLLTILSSSRSPRLRPTPWIWAACSLSSLLGCSESVSSLPRSQSLPVWIFCSPPLISLTQGSHLLIPFFCVPMSFCSWCPWAVVQCDKQNAGQSLRYLLFVYPRYTVLMRLL